MIRLSPGPGAALRAVLLIAPLLLGLGACKPQVEAPQVRGACYHMVVQAKGPPRYNLVAKGVPRIEQCMAYLEALRAQFLRQGGSHQTLEGAYNGNFIHIRREGLFTSQQYGGNEYLTLVRSGDGRLVMPGAAQPDG